MTYAECSPQVKLKDGAVFMNYETKAGMKQLFLAYKEAGVLFDTMGIPLNSSEMTIKYIYDELLYTELCQFLDVLPYDVDDMIPYGMTGELINEYFEFKIPSPPFENILKEGLEELKQHPFEYKNIPTFDDIVEKVKQRNKNKR